MNMNMLNKSDDNTKISDFQYQICVYEYNLNYHNELFIQYNSNPTQETVHNKDLAQMI